jgi:hypothetical protein
MPDGELPICVGCRQPVEVYPELYDAHSQMHLLCFHLAYEHEGDPDAPCSDSGCPQWRLRLAEHSLRRHGESLHSLLCRNDSANRLGYARDLLIRLLRETIGSMRIFARPYDAQRFIPALHHAEALLAVLTGRSSLEGYLGPGRAAYLESGDPADLSRLRYEWHELERLHNLGLSGITPSSFTLLDTLFLKLLLVALENIRRLLAQAQFEDIWHEVYHIHNVPGHLVSQHTDLLRFYLGTERAGYIEDASPELARRFEQIWRELDAETRRLVRAQVAGDLEGIFARALYLLHAPKALRMLSWLLYRLLSGVVRLTMRGYSVLVAAS